MTDKAEYAFFCTTPLHVLGAIAISRKTASKTDVYVTNQFLDSYRIVQFLKKEHVFHDVIYIDAIKQKIEVRIENGAKKILSEIHALSQYIWNCLRIKKTVRRYLNMDSDYKRIYIASNSMAGRYAILYYFKTKKRFQIWQYDDGLGSYINRIAEAIPLYDRVIRTLLFGRKSVNYNRHRILFSPEYYHMMYGDDEEVKRIPTFENEQKELIFRMYGVDQLPSMEPKVFFIDTVNEGYTKDGWNSYTMVRKRIVDLVGDSKVMIKKHPRDMEMSELDRVITSIPFEVLCMRWDMSDKTLISCRSSAMYTPRIMFDQEPDVVFLCRLLSDGLLEINTYDDIYQFRKMYRNKKRVMLPKTEEELFSYIEECLGTGNSKE